MDDTDTATLCSTPARKTWAGAVAAIGVLAAVTMGTLAPVAAARVRACPQAHAWIAASSRPVMQRAVVCLINQERHAHRLPALRENSRLNRSAQGWTGVMVSHRYFSHGADFASRISATGFHWSSVGENIATGFPTPASVVRAWMASPGHCHNILSPSFGYVGTGVSDRSIAGHGSHGGTWTQDFGVLMGPGAPSGNRGPADGCPYNH